MVKDGRPLTRAYSIVGANYEGHLEFLSAIGDGGMRYALGGNPEWAAEGARNLLKAMNSETGLFPHGDYGIERAFVEK